jgi:hypothetical protein
MFNGGIRATRHHLGQTLTLEIEQVSGRKPFALEIGRPEQSLGAKQSQGLLTFGGSVGNHSDNLGRYKIIPSLSNIKHFLGILLYLPIVSRTQRDKNATPIFMKEAISPSAEMPLKSENCQRNCQRKVPQSRERVGLK